MAMLTMLAMAAMACTAEGSQSQIVVQINGYWVGLGVAGGGAFRVNVRKGPSRGLGKTLASPLLLWYTRCTLISFFYSFTLTDKRSCSLCSCNLKDSQLHSWIQHRYNQSRQCS